MVETTTRSDIATLKILESGKKLGQMLARLKKEYLSADDMREIITVIAAQPRATDHWINCIQCIATNGVTYYLEDEESVCGVYPGDNPSNRERRADSREFFRRHPHWQGRISEYIPHVWGVNREYVDAWVTPANDREPWLLQPIRDEFKKDVGSQWTLRINGLDPLSQIGAMISVDDEGAADSWEAFSEEVWTKWAETKGNNAILKGGVKRGKTNFALLLAEKFMAKGWFVVGNIYVKDAPTNYQYCPDLSTMLTSICQARLKGLNVFIILDEAGLFWARIDTVAKQSRELSKLVLSYGKLRAILLTISHHASDLPAVVLKTSIAEFEKVSQKSVFVDINDGIKIRARLVSHVPATTLSYDPDQFQTFSVNMICAELWDFMSRIPDGTNQWEALIDYIPRHVITPREEYTDNKEAARILRASGMGVREIGRQLHEAKTTISRWTSEDKMPDLTKKKPPEGTGQGGTG
jgi:hypothetical protein